MEKKSKGLELSLTNLVSILSLISTVIYCTWYFASVEQRIALIEQQLSETRTEISQMSNQIEEIYQILLDNKKSG